jgi:hypothetical protein
LLVQPGQAAARGGKFEGKNFHPRLQRRFMSVAVLGENMRRSQTAATKNLVIETQFLSRSPI